MRVCRICMVPDVTNSLQNLFAFNGKIAAQIYSLFKIVIVDLPEEPALICRKCEKHVLQASELKKLCEISEKHFCQLSSNEYYYIHENLREVKAMVPKTIEPDIQAVAPVVTEIIFDNEVKSSEVDKIPQKKVEFNALEAYESCVEASIAVAQPATPDPTPIKIEVEEDCNSNADTEVSERNIDVDEFSFIDLMTLDQIKEMTDVLAAILLPEEKGTKSKKKKNKKNKRSAQKLTATKLSIRLKRKKRRPM